MRGKHIYNRSCIIKLQILLILFKTYVNKYIKINKKTHCVFDQLVFLFILLWQLSEIFFRRFIYYWDIKYFQIEEILKINTFSKNKYIQHILLDIACPKFSDFYLNSRSIISMNGDITNFLDKLENIVNKVFYILIEPLASNTKT